MNELTRAPVPESGRPGDPRVRVATITAVVAGLAALIALGVIVQAVRGGGPASVFDPPALTELKRELRESPMSPVLKERIREADAEIRGVFIQRQQRIAVGRWVLLGALLATLAAGRTALRYGRSLPQPGSGATSGRAYWRQAWATQDAVLFAAVALVGVGFLSLWRPLPGGAAALSAGVSVVRKPAPFAVADPSLYAKQWPGFRGPGGSGDAGTLGVATNWDGPGSNGVAWVAEVPLPGHGSPVIWQDRVFVTGADKERREVYGFDRHTGRRLWTAAVKVPGAEAAPPEVMTETGFAASTPATDGSRVYAIFANGDLAAVDMDGHEVWSQAFGPLANMYGHASSPVVWKNLVILALDQGAAEEGKSRVLALEGATGRTVWETARPVPASWATPFVAGASQAPQVILSGTPWVIGYDAASGAERWRAECLSGDVAPSPVWRAGVAYAVNAGAVLAAIRTDGTGTVTATHVVWKAEENLPDVCSPLCTGPRVYLLTSAGALTCLAAADGRKLWDHEMGGVCQASPSLAGGEVWVLLQEGTVVRVADEDAYREVGRNRIGDAGCNASPAFADGAVFVRSASRLWCLGR